MWQNKGGLQLGVTALILMLILWGFTENLIFRGGGFTKNQ